MKHLFLVGLVGALGLVAACGGDDSHPGKIDDTSGGKAGSGITPGGKAGTHGGGTGTKPEAGGGAGGEGGTVTEDALTVTITAPTAATDPNKETVVVGDEVSVVCSAVSNSSDVKVDGTSVTISVLDAQGEVAKGQDEKPLSTVGTPTGTPGEYSASFPLTTIESGAVSFRCSASSTDKSLSGSTTLATFVDHGPKITPSEPVQDSAHRLKGEMLVQFTVEPAELAPGDEGAAVTSVNLEVAGIPIKDLVPDAANPGLYEARIDFTNKSIFKDPPPEHTSIRIEAVNSRNPEAAKAVSDYPIVVDGAPPAVTYTSPEPNAPIHGDTVVEFTVEDSGAGLDVDTLEVTVTGQDTVKYDETKDAIWGRPANNKFTFRFNASGLKDVISQVTVTTKARDLAGNGETDGKTLLLYKDDQPPIIDLDPGLARAEVFESKQCSKVFDPLGLAVNDGVTLNGAGGTFRVLIYDETNDDGLGHLFISGADPKSATLYLQPDPSQPFLIDKSGDGVCDDIADADKLPLQTLIAVPSQGGLQFSKTDGDTPPLMGAECTPRDPGPEPQQLCSDKKSDLQYVVRHRVTTAGAEPVVYAMGSLDEPECTGSPWKLHSVTSKLVDGKSVSLSADGWICLAARAADRLGNRAVSRPLRVCYDDPLVEGVPGCATGAPAPDCTTSCTAPDPMPPNIYF